MSAHRSPDAFTGPEFEALLARIYVDADTRSRFLADPRRVAAEAGLGGAEARALEAIDRVGLELAAESFARKRARRPGRVPGEASRLLARVVRSPRSARDLVRALVR